MTAPSIRTILMSASLGLTLSLSAAYAPQAQAKPIKTFQIGAWKGTVQVSSKTGEFTHCTGSASYNSGIKLIFSINRDQKWGIGFAKDSWNLDAGQSYPVKYQVDRRNIWSGKAIAGSPTMAMIKLPGSSKLFAQMRRGRILKVAAGNDLLKFSLKSTNRLLKSLLKCSVDYRDVVASAPQQNQKASNPFRSASTVQQETPQQNDGSWLVEAYKRGKALMDEAGVDVTFIDPARSPDLYKVHDSVWQMGKYMGTIRIVHSGDVAGIDAKLHGEEKSKCSGGFTSRTRPVEVEGVSVRMRSAICMKQDGKQWSTLFGIYPRANGGNYVLTVFTSKADMPTTLRVGEHLTKIAARQALTNQTAGTVTRSVNY